MNIRPPGVPENWDDFDPIVHWWMMTSIIEYSNIRNLEESETLHAILKSFSL